MTYANGQYMQQAVRLANLLDTKYHETHLKYCRLSGETPAGAPGAAVFETVSQVRDHCAKRVEQIKELDKKIEVLKDGEEDLKAIQAMCKEVGITDVVTRSGPVPAASRLSGPVRATDSNGDTHEWGDNS